MLSNEEEIECNNLNRYYESMPGSTRVPSRKAAIYCGVRPKTFETWRSTGRYNGLQYIKCGSRVYYELKTLRAWLESRTCGTAGEIN